MIRWDIFQLCLWRRLPDIFQETWRRTRQVTTFITRTEWSLNISVISSNVHCQHSFWRIGERQYRKLFAQSFKEGTVFAHYIFVFIHPKTSQKTGIPFKWWIGYWAWQNISLVPGDKRRRNSSVQTCGAFLKTADNNSQSGTRTTHPSFRRRLLGISVCCHRFCSLCVVFYHLDFAPETGFVSGQNHGSSLKNALEMMMKLWHHGCTSLNVIFQCFEHRQWNSAFRILKVILKATKKKTHGKARKCGYDLVDLTLLWILFKGKD